MPQTITQSNSIIESFDIRKFADRLEPAEEKNKYICPVCGGNDLSIHPDKSPAPYQCFHGCSCDDIREAIAPWSEKRLGGYNKRVSNFKQKNVLKAVPLPDGELAIARLSEVPSDIPQPTRPQFTPKPARVNLLAKGVTQEELSQTKVISYDYGSNRAAHRYEAPSSASAKGYEKTFLLSRIDDEGVTRWNKGKHPWKAYRQDEVLAAMKAVPDGFIPILLSHEGEKCVEYARLERLAGITMSGGGSRDDMLAALSEIKSQMGERVFIFAHCTDNDPAGVLKAEKWAYACQQVQIPFVAINLKAIQPDLCDKGDIADILKITNMTGDQLAELILAQIQLIRSEQIVPQEPEDEPPPTKRGRTIPPIAAADILVEKFRPTWKYDLNAQTWRQFDGKIWKACRDEIFKEVVHFALKAMPGVKYERPAYRDNVIDFLQTELQVHEWKSFERAKWIPFNDVVLEVATGKKHEHSPGFMFTFCLEHKCPKEKLGEDSNLLGALKAYAPTFYDWLAYAQNGDPSKMLKILAFFNGVLTSKFSKLQMFMLIIGVPGSGKGTLARLLESVVGNDNHAPAKLHKLGDGNTIASIIDKQLVICPDEKKQPCDNSAILSLTGGDNIPYRQVYRPMASGTFEGALMVLGNANPFMGDTTGLERRWSLAQFDNPLPDRNPEVEIKMHSELGAIIAIALSMKDEHVNNLIKGVGEGEIPDFKRQQWLHRTDNDSVALFMEEMLVSLPLSCSTMLGGKGDNTNSIYGAYLTFCEDNNTKTFYTKQNFRRHLIELCREVGWNVSETRCASGWKINGIGIRSLNDDSPRISEKLGASVNLALTHQTSFDLKPLPDKDSVDLSPLVQTHVDPNVDFKPLPDKDSVDYVDLLGNNNYLEKTQTRTETLDLEENLISKSLSEPPKVYTTSTGLEQNPFNESNSGSVDLTAALNEVYTTSTEPEPNALPESNSGSVDLTAALNEVYTTPSNEEIKVGSRVTMADPTQFRANDVGTVEGVFEIEFNGLCTATSDLVVCWDSDGVNQKPQGQRRYSACELKRVL